MVEIILKKDEHIDVALKRFRRKVRKSNILRDVAKRAFYMKPSAKRNEQRRSPKRR